MTSAINVLLLSVINLATDIGYLGVDLQEDSYTRDVVNHAVVLLPLLGGRAHYCVARLLGTVVLVVRPDDGSDLFVA